MSKLRFSDSSSASMPFFISSPTSDASVVPVPGAPGLVAPGPGAEGPGPGPGGPGPGSGARARAWGPGPGARSLFVVLVLLFLLFVFVYPLSSVAVLHSATLFYYNTRL